MTDKDIMHSADDQRTLGQKELALIRNNAPLIIAVMLIGVALLLLNEVLEGQLIALDEHAYRFFVQTLRSELLTPIMVSISGLAMPVVLVVVWLVAAAFAPGKRPGLSIVTNLIIAVLLNQTLKFLIQRPRPEGFSLVVESGFSFPSGHSMVAMAFYGLLAYLAWRYEKDRILRWVWLVSLVSIVLMVGISRIYLGVHYASDVIAGFCISAAWLVLYIKLAVPLFLQDPIPDVGK